MAGIGPLEDQVKNTSARGHTTYLGGLSFPGQVVDFYRSIDVFVVPSITEGRFEEQGPRAVIEAMMTGCLVVGTDCGSIPSMVGSNGIIVPQRDVVQLAHGIREACRYIEAGYDTAKAKGDYDVLRARNS